MRMTILVACLWLATSPLWGKIVFESGRDGNLEIYSMNSDGMGQTRLTHNEAHDFAAAWSPNGRQIAFTRARDDEDLEIYVMDADGGNQHNLTHHPALDGDPDWSPDGSQIAFTSERTNGLSIFVMDPDGANVSQLTEGPFDVIPKWSPDGKRIAFEAMLGLGHGRQIYVMNADGTNRWQVSEPIPQAGMFMMGWSPDGKKILYMEAIDSTVHDVTLIIATLNPIRQEVTHFDRVRLPKMPISGAAWGADGKSILITTKPPDGPMNLDWNIYRLRLTDRKLIQLTHHVWRDSGPQEWNPRLSVQPQQRLLPLFWGEIKSNRLRH